MAWRDWLGLPSAPEPEPTPEEHVLLRTSGAFDAQVADFWASMSMVSGASNQTLLERVWVANHCLQMNASAIATMPMRHYGSARTPAWVSNPDPNWYPNGIADAVFAIVHSYYGSGDAFVYVTSRYADGYPSGWTVLDAAQVSVEVRDGRRRYRYGQTSLDERDMVQISRDPRPGSLRGTPAIASFAPYTNGLLAAADLGNVMMGSGGTPSSVLKSTKRLSEEQATALQAQWMTATSTRRGAPAVLPPEISFETNAFSPADLMLLDVQKFDAQVVANAFGIPAVLVNMSIEGGLNYQTPLLALEQWWRTELRTTAYRVGQGLQAQMLPAGSYVKFDPDEFLAPTWRDRVEAWVLMREKGLVSDEEFRTIVLGLSPQVTEQSALDELSTPPSAGASPAQQPSSVIALRPNQAVGQ